MQPVGVVRLANPIGAVVPANQLRVLAKGVVDAPPPFWVQMSTSRLALAARVHGGLPSGGPGRFFETVSRNSDKNSACGTGVPHRTVC
jgi:hypothetical protein